MKVKHLPTGIIREIKRDRGYILVCWLNHEEVYTIDCNVIIDTCLLLKSNCEILRDEEQLSLF